MWGVCMSLTKLKDKVFTIINRIPTSANNAQITAYRKHILAGCDVQTGFFDKSTGTMVYKANTWTAWTDDWGNYKTPSWLDGGYYALASDKKDGYFTANNGDLLIFDNIPDLAPTTTQEFQALVTKYKDLGGLITAANIYINFKDDNPWKTNHIELIKG